MAHAEHEVFIHRSPADVFAFLADGMNNPQWRPGVKKIVLMPGPMEGPGTVYRQVLAGPAGRSIRGDYEITDAVPKRELGFKVIAGPARPTGHYSLEEHDGGTLLRFVLDFQPTGFRRLLDGVIAKTMKREVVQLDRLKRVLEHAGD